MDILYFCDKEKCGDNCSYPLCMHTRDINHAKNRYSDSTFFIPEMKENGQQYLVEVTEEHYLKHLYKGE